MLAKEKTWKRVFNTNSELSQNRTWKQIIPFKALNWLFTDIWCYLVIDYFDWKFFVFWQTAVRVYSTLNVVVISALASIKKPCLIFLKFWFLDKIFGKTIVISLSVSYDYGKTFIMSLKSTNFLRDSDESLLSPEKNKSKEIWDTVLWTKDSWRQWCQNKRFPEYTWFLFALQSYCISSNFLSKKFTLSTSFESVSFSRL